MTIAPPPTPENDHSRPENDPTGTIRRLTNGALIVKRDISLKTGMLWLVVIRPEDMINAVLWDHEVTDSQVIGAMPHTPAAQLAEDNAAAELTELRDLVDEYKHDRDRVREALLPKLRAHHWTAHEVASDDLQPGYIAEQAERLLRHHEIQIERLESQISTTKDHYQHRCENLTAQIARLREGADDTPLEPMTEQTPAQLWHWLLEAAVGARLDFVAKMLEARRLASAAGHRQLLPKPNEVDTERVAYWGEWRGRCMSFVSAGPDGRVDLSYAPFSRRIDPAEARGIALQLLAAADYAEQVAK